MSRLKLLITFFLLYTIFHSTIFSSVNAGLMISKGSVELKALERKEVCDAACIFSTYDNPITCKLSPDNSIKEFVEESEEFTLEDNILDCPEEPKARRQCIADQCSLYGDKARLTCIEFHGPLRIVFKPSLNLYGDREQYKGSIRAICKVGTATTVEPIEFYVNFYPLNLTPIFIVVVIVLIVTRIIKEKIS